MRNYLQQFNIQKKKNILILLLVIIFLPGKFIYCQSKTNLNLFYSLVDSAVISASKYIPSDQKDIKLNLKLGNSYSIFEDRIISDFAGKGKKIVPNDSLKQNDLMLNFVCENANVTYGKMYRDGLFGSFYVPRTVSIAGNYIFPYSDAKLHNFNYSISDTVKVNDIKSIENNSYPFTQGQVPQEPFFPSLIEPVIAIGATALAVILFFTVRSK
jgi:hypothetical protein